MTVQPPFPIMTFADYDNPLSYFRSIYLTRTPITWGYMGHVFWFCPFKVTGVCMGSPRLVMVEYALSYCLLSFLRELPQVRLGATVADTLP